MAWKIEYTSRAAKDLTRLDKAVAARIAMVMVERVALDPHGFGKRLRGPLGGFQRYRIGHYRVLARIEVDRLVVLVVRVGHRSTTYEQK